MFVFRVKEIREQKNVDLNDLAKETELPISYINSLESNDIEDTMLSKLYKIAKVFQVDIKDLYYTIEDYELLKNRLDEIVDSDNMSSEEVQKISKILDKLLNYINR